MKINRDGMNFQPIQPAEIATIFMIAIIVVLASLIASMPHLCVCMYVCMNEYVDPQ